MFEIFKNLFNKITPIKSGDSIYIDITNKKIKINSNKISIPCDIDKLALILGQPRAQHYETKSDDKVFLEKLHNNAKVTDRVNYMWDNLGIKCYTLDGKTVNTFGIELNKGILEYPNVPQRLFEGTLTINGQHWLPVIKSGRDEMVLQKKQIGYYSLCAEYVDIDQDMSSRTEKDYTGIEVALP